MKRQNVPIIGAIIIAMVVSTTIDRIMGNELDSHDLSMYSANVQDSQLRYEAPDDCNYAIRNNVEAVLECQLRTVNSEFDTTNFSVIPSEHTISLTIRCNEDIMARSELMPNSFAHLVQLKELALEYCKFGKFGQQALGGLTDLRNLTVRTHNINWPALNLELEPNTFQTSKNLEFIDLSMNNIWSLPENLFCSLTALNFLNISGNRLQDINDLGFRERPPLAKDDNARNTDPILAKQNGCLLDLEMIDVSHNHFVLLPGNGFGTLKRLKYLKAHDNEISMVADKALSGLKSLQVINLSSNKIVALPSELFQDPVHSIQEIYLQNNSISVLAPGLFANLDQLQLLDLSSNQLTSAWIDHTTFIGLIRLVLLNLSSNKITKLDRAVFNDLYTLQILNLRFNQLENIAADTFSPMNNLHTLLLSHNKIKYLDAYSLNGLYVLSLLSLDNNALTGVHPEAFRNCSSLQDLNLNGNELTKVPIALKDMRILKTVDLGENKLTQLDEPGFKGMNNLYGLRLIGNLIENVTVKAFKSLPSLQILNLARNRIRYIEKGTFEHTTSIQAIRLDQNQLTDIEGLFTNMPNLLWLNVSDNRLNYFDFGHIPLNLQWLDLHKNQLETLENRYGLENELRLQTLDASFNLLTKVKPLSIPNNIELLFLNDNLIDGIEPHTFMHKTNLTRVDLYANRMTSLDIKALRLMPVQFDRMLPEFYIGGNPFICDCNIDWLQKINQVTTRQYPRVMDIDTIYCKLLYNRDRSYIQLIDAEPINFLCPYKTHCFALCHCCEFDACDCEMTCPNNCTCFHDQSWSTNVVECSAAGYTEMPSNIPMDTTEVYIDGNNLGELSGHSFIGRKNLRILFANNSYIHTVYNTTFAGLRRLSILHLENNIIQRFVGNEFLALENLLELYLQNNRISFIETHTFAEMKRIEVLRLDGNRLVNFEAWQLTANPYLVEIGLAENPWTCDCTFVNKFKIYLASNTEKIIDTARISCVYNNATSILKDKNGTKCTIRDGGLPMVRSQEIEDLLPMLLAATCAFIGFFGLILGIFCYRKELKVLAHSTCSQFCYKPDAFVNEFDKDRLYDAYITYSLQDDHFVNQILAPTLENDIGYRLCLHYRDFNANAYVADTIVEAVESSRRAILVLSKNFLYNEWTRFEFKGAIHEVLKRRRKLIIVLYGDLPQRDLDADIRLYLRSNTCIEWDDKKFWQKLRIAMPQVKKNHCLAKQSAVNIYATAHNYNTAARRMVVPSANGPARFDCNNYATIAANNCPRNCDNYESVNLNCKYNTMNERRMNDFSLPPQQRQHEYAEPTNLLIEQQQPQPRQHCDGTENFECTSSSKYSSSSSATSRGSSECSHPSLGGRVKQQKPTQNGATDFPTSTNPKNGVVHTGASSLSQNFTNTHNRKSNVNMCATTGPRPRDASPSDSHNKNNGDDSGAQFSDKRLPQAMWA